MKKPIDEFVLNTNSDQSVGLRAWYPGGRWAGTNVLRDMSGHNNHGVLISFANPYTVTSGWRWGKDGGKAALAFDGTAGRCVSSFASSISPVGNRTIVAWINMSTTSRQGILATRTAATPVGFIFNANLTTAGNLTYGHIGGGTLTVAAGLVVGKWFQVAAVLSGTNASLYVNGVVIGTQGSFGAESASSFNGVIGDESASLDTPWEGLIEDVRIYGIPKSAEQIAAMYQNPWELRYPLGRRTYFLPPSGGVSGAKAFLGMGGGARTFLGASA